jgi:hypothetical protein
MLRHWALHERPEVRPRMLVKRPASPGPGHGFHCFTEFGWYSSLLDIVFWFPGPLVIY